MNSPSTYEQQCAAAAERHADREHALHFADDDAPSMLSRVRAAAAARAEIEVRHTGGTVTSMPVVPDIVSDAIGTPKLDKTLQDLAALCARPWPNDALIGRLFRTYFDGAIRAYAESLERAQDRGVPVAFSNESGA